MFDEEILNAVQKIADEEVRSFSSTMNNLLKEIIEKRAKKR